MSNIEKTICVRAWNYPIVDMGNNQLKNCCKTRFNPVASEELKMGTDLFGQLPAIKRLKHSLLNGVQTRECTSCWKSEEFGATSYRLGFDQFIKFIKAVKWQHLTYDQVKHRLLNLSEADKEELINLEHPTQLEILISTLCDLKCVYCSPRFSSQWHAEKIKYKELPPINILQDGNPEYENILWDWFTKTAHKSINNITFVGGEPLINDKFYNLVEKLIDFYKNMENPHPVDIFVATNLNTPKKYFNKLRDILKKIMTVPTLSFTVGVSFEATGKKHEFIRSNADWETFDNNMTALTTALTETDPTHKHLSLVTMPSFNSLSISDLPNFVSYIIKLKDTYTGSISISTTHVVSPMKYAPFILTPNFNAYIDQASLMVKQSKYYRDMPHNVPGSWTKFTDYLETLKHSILHESSDKNTERGALIQELNTLKERRNLDYEQTFPEMKQFFNLCSKTLT